ncbi:MAG: BolA family transcriptional regulator [Pseudomonadota bacterium]
MTMTATQIEALLRPAFPDALIELTDTAGDGDHWSARIVSAAFRGKSRVQQHQMVYAAIGAQMGGELHALALQTAVPD